MLAELPVPIIFFTKNHGRFILQSAKFLWEYSGLYASYIEMCFFGNIWVLKGATKFHESACFSWFRFVKRRFWSNNDSIYLQMCLYKCMCALCWYGHINLIITEYYKNNFWGDWHIFQCVYRRREGKVEVEALLAPEEPILIAY